MELAELIYEECHAEEYILDISEPSENDSESQIEIESSNRPKKRAKTSNWEWFMNPKNR